MTLSALEHHSFLPQALKKETHFSQGSKLSPHENRRFCKLKRSCERGPAAQAVFLVTNCSRQPCPAHRSAITVRSALSRGTRVCIVCIPVGKTSLQTPLRPSANAWELCSARWVSGAGKRRQMNGGTRRTRGYFALLPMGGCMAAWGRFMGADLPNAL